MTSGTALVAAALAVLLLAVPGCTDAGSGEPVMVLAASSLTEPFTEIGRRFEADHPGTAVAFSFAASSELVQQAEAGAPADVVATADERTMGMAVDARTVEEPVMFARNRLAILVAQGNPEGIGSVADLGRAGVTFVVCAPEVPCGQLGASVLENAGVDADPESLEPNVRAAVTRVTTGEVDAALVYATDVSAADGRADGVDIPPDVNGMATYPIAVVRASEQQARARLFIDYVRSEPGREVMADAGFQPAG